MTPQQCKILSHPPPGRAIPASAYNDFIQRHSKQCWSDRRVVQLRVYVQVAALASQPDNYSTATTALENAQTAVRVWRQLAGKESGSNWEKTAGFMGTPLACGRGAYPRAEQTGLLTYPAGSRKAWGRKASHMMIKIQPRKNLVQCPKHCPGARGVLLASNIQLVKGSLTVANIKRPTRTIRKEDVLHVECIPLDPPRSSPEGRSSERWQSGSETGVREQPAVFTGRAVHRAVHRRILVTTQLQRREVGNSPSNYRPPRKCQDAHLHVCTSRQGLSTVLC